jgi:phage gp29-like protein
MADSTLYDAYGRPVRRGELGQETIGASLMQVRALWSESVASGLTPQRLASLLRNAAQGDSNAYLTLAEEMEERDLHYGSVLHTRRLAVTGLECTVEAASDAKSDQALADEVRALVLAPAFNELLFDAMDALGKGFAACEILWDLSAQQWLPVAYPWRDPRLFLYERLQLRELRIADPAVPLGVPLPPFKFICHTPKVKSGIPLRGGLARFAAWAYLVKAYDVKDWLGFVEVFGMPLRLGKYHPGASEQDKDELLRAVANIGSDAAGIIPATMMIEFVQSQGGRGGGSDVFEHLADWTDKQISKAVLGQTMTTDSGSSRAQAEVHDQVRQDLMRADARQLAATLNRDLVKPYIDLNHGPQAAYPRLCLPVEAREDLAQLSDSLAKLVPLGLRVEQSVIRDKLGLPDPEEDAELLSAPKPAAPPIPPVPPPTTGEAAQASRLLLALMRRMAVPNRAQNAANPADALDELEALALEDWQAQMDPILEPLRKLMDEAGSYEELLRRLPEALNAADVQRLADAIAAGTFEARAEGDEP